MEMTDGTDGANGTTERIEQILRFLEEADAFKRVARAVDVLDGSRAESDAEHAWHMGLYAALLHELVAPEADLGHALTLILVHDLAEIYAGDVYAHDAAARRGKHERELAAAERLFAMLPVDLGERVRRWWDEYEAGETVEARFARAMDRLQAFAQNVFAGGAVWRERGVSEAASRAYNTSAMQLHPELGAIFEVLYARANERDLWKRGETGPAGAPTPR